MVRHAVMDSRTGDTRGCFTTQLGSEPTDYVLVFVLANYETEYLHSHITIHNCNAHAHVQFTYQSNQTWCTLNNAHLNETKLFPEINLADIN